MAKKLKIIPELEVAPHLVGQIQSKLAYVDEGITAARVAEDGKSIELDLRGGEDAGRAAEIEEKVQRVVNEMAKGSYVPKVEVLENFLDRPTSFSQDPMDELIASGEVSQEGTGIYTFGPMLTRLIAYLQDRFNGLAEHFDAAPYRFPTLMSAEMLDRVEYFRAFPHSLTFATHLREDLDVINHFAENAVMEGKQLSASMDSFSKVEAMLSPAVCYHLYYSLADKPLPVKNMVATAVGNCFRYESNNLVSLERLWNFTMQEIIFIGDKDFVLEKREQARNFMRPIFEDIGLVYMVETANDPFFVGEFRKQAMFQNAFQLKYEIQASLPFKDDTLAVGSYNYHQDFFGRNLNITLADGSPIHTGCTAFGLERMAFAFLAQHGLDKKNWPAPVREAVG